MTSLWLETGSPDGLRARSAPVRERGLHAVRPVRGLHRRPVLGVHDPHALSAGSGGHDERHREGGDALAAPGEAEAVGRRRRHRDRRTAQRGRQHRLGLGAARARSADGSPAPARRRCRRASPPRRAGPAVRARNASACAPAYSGWSVPKCVPMSPRPAADSSASTIACATASPSECPDSAGSPGHSRPASHSVPSPPNACTSVPTPTRGTAAGASRRAIDGSERMPRDERPRTLEVGGGRDLERERVALDDGDVVTGGRDQGRVVGVLLVGDRVRGIQDVAAEALRRLRRRRARRGRRRRRSRGVRRRA